MRVLPARAGMSPMNLKSLRYVTSAPRTGGDEPGKHHLEARNHLCSPHGRG